MISLSGENRIVQIYPSSLLLLKKFFSFAASERVFSLLKASFSDQQELTLQDYVEASLMLQYNGH